MRVPFQPEVEDRLRPLGAEAAKFGLPAWAVGGIVRDALLGHPSKDIDVAIDGDPGPLVRGLAELWSAECEQRDRFSTATLILSGSECVDVVRTRSESYEHPGALPVVQPGRILEDLERRDFTVNAMAASLSPDDFGELLDPFDGRSDLEANVIRVLHSRSFVDDPTRLFRAARYAIRFGLSPDEMTESAARVAVSDGALATISADRRRNEVLAICGERHWSKAVAWLNRWGVWTDLASWEPHSSELQRADAVLNWAQRAIGETLPAILEFRWLTLLAHAPNALYVPLAVKPAEAATVQWVREAGEGAQDEAEWRRTLDARPVAVILAAMTLMRSDVEKGRLTHYLTEVRPRRLTITGDDLVEAGAAPGPALGQALRATLDAVRAGQVNGRAAELEHAMREWRRAQEHHAT